MSLETELFELIKTEKYPEALILSTSKKDLNINALDDEGCSFFMAAIENDFDDNQNRYEFMEYLLVHPNFKQASTSIDGYSTTPFEMAIEKNDPTAIALILKHKDSKEIQVVFNEKDKLLYELQVKKIQRTQKRQEEKPSTTTAEALDKQQQILASLLNAAVLHAIKTDDPSILQRLADAGAKLHYPLKDGTYPMDLVRKQTDLKVHHWLSSYIKQQISSNPTFTLASHSLARKHGEKEQAIVEKRIEKTSESIKSMFKFFDYQEPLSEEEKKLQATSSKSKTPSGQ